MLSPHLFILTDFGIADYRTEKYGFIYALLTLAAEIDDTYDGPPGAGCYQHCLQFFEARLGQNHFVTELLHAEFQSKANQ